MTAMDMQNELTVDRMPNEDHYSVDELSEDGITGDELGEDDLPGDLLQKPESLAATEGTSSSDNIENDLRQAKKLKKKSWILGALTLFLLVAFGAVGLIYYKRSVHRIAEPKFPTVTMPIPPITEVWLKDFLLPLKSDHPDACISFSIVIRSRDTDFIQKLSDQNQWLRARIYDILLDKIQKEKDEPSLETLRQWVLQAFARVMPASHVEGVIIHHFLLV